jgi:hypothetical protein
MPLTTDHLCSCCPCHPQVQFIYEKDREEEFAKHFDMAQLPPELGGTGDRVPVEQAWQQILAEEAKIQGQGQGQQGDAVQVAAAAEAPQ